MFINSLRKVNEEIITLLKLTIHRMQRRTNRHCFRDGLFIYYRRHQLPRDENLCSRVSAICRRRQWRNPCSHCHLQRHGQRAVLSKYLQHEGTHEQRHQQPTVPTRRCKPGRCLKDPQNECLHQKQRRQARCQQRCHSSVCQ